jgi:glycosyltransferase involved in cell wall biosynthesis
VRILHIGRDFLALRSCGLTLYSDALMRAQLAGGHQVAYFFAGRHYPKLERPRLRRWNSDGLPMYELLSTRIHTHWTRGTRHPLHDLADPDAERAFATTLRATRPDVVHAHELSGLPSSILGQAKAAGAAVVMTLHDYTPLCAAVRRVDLDGNLCLRRDVGEDCSRNCAAAPDGDAHLVEATMRYELRRIREAHPRVAGFARERRRAVIRRTLALLGGRPMPAGDVATAETAPPTGAPPEHYQRRRETNLERLNGCDRLVAPSGRVAEIYATLGVDPGRIVVQRLTQPHLESLEPLGGPEPADPLTFVTLGSLGTPTKGSEVVLGAVRRLEEAGYGGRYRLRVLGDVAPALLQAAEAEPAIELRGGYYPHELRERVGDGDVGLVPSVWEEVHGFVGIEMLALGMPLIGSALGGITEYVVEGETGWLNRSAGAEELAGLMMRLIDDPGEVERMKRSVRERRDEHVRRMAPHVAEVEALYAELLAPAAAEAS